MPNLVKLSCAVVASVGVSACGGSSSGPDIPQLMLAPEALQSGDVVLSNGGDGTMPVINGQPVDLTQGVTFGVTDPIAFGQPLDKSFEYLVGTAGSLVGSVFVQQTNTIVAADGLSLSRGQDTTVQIAGDAQLSGPYRGFIRDANAPLRSGGFDNAAQVSGNTQVTVNLGEGTFAGSITDRRTNGFVPFLPTKQGADLDDLTITSGMLDANGVFTGQAIGGNGNFEGATVTAFPATINAMIDRESATGAASDLVAVGTVEQRQTIRLAPTTGPAQEFTTRETGVFVID
ncbi:hypothetical protein [Yoonia sp. 208BN28-4]|uniref:hypothetical protein n=1 Tax=Yoonia sp. 208BN28-4 TaxID=3126505 RepID=UPI0030A5975F